MKIDGLPKPINATQEEFLNLCKLGGGSNGGPARSKVQQLLRARGQKLNERAYDEVAIQMEEFASRNPWHVCFAIGMSWGRLAKLELAFTAAAVNLIEEWNDGDLKIARAFHFERGPEPIEHSLRGAHILFSKVTLPSKLPNTFDGLRRAQDRWLSPILSPERPRYIGSWNATAMFMAALFAQPDLAKAYRDLSVMLPPGGPIFAALKVLHQVHILSKPPDGSALDDEAFEPGVIYSNNALFEELLKGLADCSLIDLHSGLYMLGTRLPESKQWE
ncbi:MAG TPA: hypothetical protein VMF66_10875 [Candidatus Acidoferrum sp.]|nr:hypothetical protein [Candidatus Acidoferrum sp.]